MFVGIAVAIAIAIVCSRAPEESCWLFDMDEERMNIRDRHNE